MPIFCCKKSCIGCKYSNCPTPLLTNKEILCGFPTPQKGKQRCNGHQARIPCSIKRTAVCVMDNVGTPIMPTSAKDFEELYLQVKGVIGGIKGIGPLTIYDVTLRLGQNYGILPQNYVYLHAAPLVNAKLLEKRGYIVLPPIKQPCVPIDVFSVVFPNLCAAAIERYLCIRSKEIATLPQVSAPCSIEKQLHIP